MAKKQTLNEIDKLYIGNTFHRLPVEITRAKGSYVFDKKGKKYLDLMTGIAVLPLGHCAPEVKKAITTQAGKYVHLSNYFADTNQVDLAKLLVENTYADKVFFVNSGAEAVDVAVKLARKWAIKNRNPKAHEIISTTQSFHGRTLGAISLTGQDSFHKDITPLMGGVKTVPYNDIGAIRRAISKKTAAVIVEPIQCEGGINIPLIDYLTQLKNLCKKNNVLLIADEIQTGLGRTGKFLASEHSLMQPNITLLGKSLGGGLPLSAVITTDKVASAFTYGDHGTTMGGSPIACAAGLATMNVILKNKLIKKAETLGTRFINELFSLQKKYDKIQNIRGMGLIIGFDFEYAAKLTEECLKHGLIINKVQQKTIRFVPAFNLKDTEVKAAFSILQKCMAKVLRDTL